MNDEQLKELKEFQERYNKFTPTFKFAEKVSNAFIEKSLRVDPSEDLLYHYTNIEALASGLLVKEPKEGEEISLWATDSKYLNDQTEIKLGSQTNGTGDRSACPTPQIPIPQPHSKE